MANHLGREAVVHALGGRVKPGLETVELRRRLVRRYELSLARLLNSLRKPELETLAEDCKLSTSGSAGELRARLWLYGARLEAGSERWLGAPWQPVPIALSGKLEYQGPIRGLCPRCDSMPRAVPEPVSEPEAIGEPESLEDLLDRASRLVGIRLGRRGADKGIYGTRIAELMGVQEHGFAEPDWRGEVEIKTVPVVRDRAGWWRVKEDPAISMEGVDPRLKLERVLWIARVADEEDSPILSWYYQEWDAAVARWAHRYLHQRPKGGAGTTAKGWYLQKRFFLVCGFLRSLNG
jgi:hypothetical protein